MAAAANPLGVRTTPVSLSGNIDIEMLIAK